MEASKPDVFSNVNFTVWRENNVYTEKESILELLTSDITNYFKEYINHAVTNGIPVSSEIYIGYVVYSKLEVNPGKIANVLNLLVQNINPDIRIQSQWDVEATANTQIQTVRGVETKDVDKIRIKVIIRPNDKNLAIKKISSIAIENISKTSKKLQTYLSKYKTIIGDK
jgi:hypothetical protein